MANRQAYKPRPFPRGIPKEVICPHCLESFPLWDMDFTGPSGEVAKAKPTVADRVSGLPPREAKDSKGRSLREKQCPLCHAPLPWTAGEQHDLIIGMVGASESGKSHYVATLIQRLMNEVGRDFQAALLNVDQVTAERYRDVFYQPLYRNRMQLAFSQQQSIPLVYSLTFDGSTTRTAGNRRSVTLLFYDTAGENFTSQTAINDFVKYLSRASGLIFVIDPLQADEVRDKISDERLLPINHVEGAPREIINTVVNHLLQSGYLKTGTRLPIPVAVAFTKCDVLRGQNLLPEQQSVWFRDRFHDQGFYDMGIHAATQNVFEQFTEGWQGFKRIAEVHFEAAAYFGVSATGCAADANGRFPSINPWRVEDPLLWLLYYLGVIESGSNEF
jgi:Double-GTPase 2